MVPVAKNVNIPHAEILEDFRHSLMSVNDRSELDRPVLDSLLQHRGNPGIVSFVGSQKSGPLHSLSRVGRVNNHSFLGLVIDN